MIDVLAALQALQIFNRALEALHAQPGVIGGNFLQPIRVGQKALRQASARKPVGVAVGVAAPDELLDRHGGG